MTSALRTASLIFFVVAFLAAVQGNDFKLVKTPLGVARGLVGPGFYSFRGLPYAEPPVGERRWQPPVMKATWGSGVLDATKPGYCCMQPDRGDINEDCLSLNVYVPQNATFGGTGPELLPVILWIHGGAFITGCSHDRVFTGDFVANSTNTILVTINYRLGAFGTFINDVTAGNFGLMDQVLAMEWTKSYISFFGGDPNRVTLAGESAGAISVGMHLASPISIQKNLFQGAILESDPISFQSPAPEEAKKYTTFLGVYLGCLENDMDCFRSKRVDEIITAQQNVLVVPWPPSLTITALPWMPFIDNYIIPDQALRRLAQGKFHKVPVLLGTNKNETLTFGIDITSPLHNQIYDLEYAAVIYLLFNQHAADVLRLYPPSYKDQDFKTLMRLSTDFLFMCSTRNAALSIAASGQPVYLYYFTRSSPPHTNPIVPSYCSQNGSVCHASELLYVFHTSSFFASEGFLLPPEDEQLSWRMLQYWAAFAHLQTGRNTPNAGALWTPFTSSSLASIVFDVPQIQMVQGLNKGHCDFWDSVGYHF